MEGLWLGWGQGVKCREGVNGLVVSPGWCVKILPTPSPPTQYPWLNSFKKRVSTDDQFRMRSLGQASLNMAVFIKKEGGLNTDMWAEGEDEGRVRWCFYQSRNIKIGSKPPGARRGRWVRTLITASEGTSLPIPWSQTSKLQTTRQYIPVV